MTSWFTSNVSNQNPIDDEFEIGDEIGRGGTAIVYQAVQKGTGQIYAIKKINKRTNASKSIKSEVNVLLTLAHDNIIKLKDIYETATDVLLVLEYVDGGELFDRIVERGFYSEKDASHVVRQILEALSYLHHWDIIHRDLKPENLLFSDNSENAKLKIADFGLARLDSDATLKTICGTPGYVAPETLMGKGYSKTVDIWAVGVITYILLCGFEPFYDGSETAMFQKILKCNYEFSSPYWDKVSENAKDLVRKMLVLDPAKRLTAKQALYHPWVQGKATGFEHLETAMANLREFNAKRKFKGVVKMVSAIANMSEKPLE